MGGSNGKTLEVTEEDALRAQLYGLLASLLAAPPTPEVLAIVGAIKGDETELGQALKLLAKAARGTTIEDGEDEYQALFIGVGAGELTPYASYYLAGFMFEKPLAKLRIEMGRLGIARADHVHEPEDHIASLCEMMCGLITGTYGEPADLARQQTFFDVHLASWAELFFKDLEAASGANFYKPVGTVGRLFMEVEAQAFKIAA
jgi:TorA maturation chaperone TorD